MALSKNKKNNFVTKRRGMGGNNRSFSMIATRRSYFRNRQRFSNFIPSSFKISVGDFKTYWKEIKNKKTITFS